MFWTQPCCKSSCSQGIPAQGSTREVPEVRTLLRSALALRFPHFSTGRAVPGHCCPPAGLSPVTAVPYHCCPRSLPSPGRAVPVTAVPGHCCSPGRVVPPQSCSPGRAVPEQGCPPAGLPPAGLSPVTAVPCHRRPRPGAGGIAGSEAPHGSAAARRREGAGSAWDRCHIPGMGLPLPPKSELPLKNPFLRSLGNTFPAFFPFHPF